jgi:hypothetical protein
MSFEVSKFVCEQSNVHIFGNLPSTRHYRLVQSMLFIMVLAMSKAGLHAYQA